MSIDHTGGRIYDILTGERVQLGEKIIPTGILTRTYSPERSIRSQRELFIKEATLVWLAEKAGYTLVASDAGDSGNTKSVDEPDVSVGGGEAEAGEAEAGGSKKPARRSSRTTKGK